MTTAEFINLVKGKKIRWFCWNNNTYFIPNGNYISSIHCYFEGTHFFENGKTIIRQWQVAGGLNSKEGWLFVDVCLNNTPHNYRELPNHPKKLIYCTKCLTLDKKQDNLSITF